MVLLKKNSDIIDQAGGPGKQRDHKQQPRQQPDGARWMPFCFPEKNEVNAGKKRSRNEQDRQGIQVGYPGYIRKQSKKQPYREQEQHHGQYKPNHAQDDVDTKLYVFTVPVSHNDMILAQNRPAFPLFEVAQVCFWRQRKQGFIHQFDGIFNILLMQHLHSGMHVA